MKQVFTRLVMGTAVLGASLIPGVASADRLSYAFVQLNGTLGGTADGLKSAATPALKDADGSSVGLSFGWIMGPYAFADVRFDSYSFDKGIDGSETSARIGVRNKLPVVLPWRIDGYGAVSLENRDFKIPASSFSETGVGLYAGLRASPVDQFEVNLEAGYQNLGDFNAGLATVGAQWNITPFFAANVGYRYADYVGKGPDVDISGIRLGIRTQWGGG